MELRHLRYFVAIAEALSFRRAAERLRLTRPALSKQLKELEDEIGVRLLERTTSRVSLTAAGAIYLHEVREILARTEQAGVLARESARGRRGVLAIGEPGPLGLPFLTAALTAFRAQFPQVEVVLKEIARSEQVGALANGDIQVGFAFDKQLSARPAVESFAVLESRLGVAMSRTHPLAKRRSLRPVDLEGEPLLCIGETRRSEHASTIRAILAEAGVKAASLRGVAAFGSLMTMIASGHGISLLPLELAHYREGHVVILPIEADAKYVDSELRVIWRKGDESALVRNFVRTLRNFAQRAAA